MVDPIAIAEQIINIALFINDTIEEVKNFKKYAERLLFRIDQIKPSLDRLVKMKDKKDQLHDLQQEAAFVKSLTDMLVVLKEIEAFVQKLDKKGKLDKLKSKEKIKGQFDDFEYKLNVLQGSLTLGVVTEVKKDVDTEQTDSAGYNAEELAEMADNMSRVKTTLRESEAMICKGLDIDEDIIERLLNRKALLTHDAQAIRSKKLEDDKAQELVSILKRKPVTAYDSFMDMLRDTNKHELYDQIRQIQEKNGYVKGGPPSQTNIQPTMAQQPDSSTPTGQPTNLPVSGQPVQNPATAAPPSSGQPAPPPAAGQPGITPGAGQPPPGAGQSNPAHEQPPGAPGYGYGGPAHAPQNPTGAPPAGAQYQGYHQHPQQPQTGHGAAPNPQYGYGQQYHPPPAYGQQPPPGYQQPPAQGYQQQPHPGGYGHPQMAAQGQPGYHQPPQGYGQPAPQYGQPAAPGMGYPGQAPPASAVNNGLQNVDPKYMVQVTEADIGGIAKIIGTQEELSILYTELGMKNRDIKAAEKQANSNDPTTKARNVLLNWRQRNGKLATRDKILTAMRNRGWGEDCDEVEEDIFNKS